MKTAQRHRRLLAPLLAALALAGCFPSSKVKVWNVPEAVERRYASVLDDGRLSPVSSGALAEHGLVGTTTIEALDTARAGWHGEVWEFELARAELAALQAFGGDLEARAPVLGPDERGYLLEACLSAWRARLALGRPNVFDPRHRHAVDLYNATLDLLVRESLSAYGCPARWTKLAGVGRTLSVRLADADGADAGTRWDPRDFDRYIVADTVQFEGLRRRNREFGLGTPLVAVRANDGTSRPAIPYYPPEGIVHAATLVLRPGESGADEVCIELVDPMGLDPDALDVPIAADTTAPFAYLTGNSRLQSIGTQGFFDADAAAWHRGLFLLQPYDPERIPVVMVHGLMSNPLTWREPTAAIWADPELRRRFQVWHFMYPTANPVLISAMDLRRALRDLRAELDPEGDDPAMQGMVVVAHSMGGLLSKTLVQDPGEQLWDLRFERTLDELDLSAEDRELLRDVFLFEPQPYIDRIVFNAVPHRGSEFAYNSISSLGDVLLSVESRIQEAAKRVERTNPGAMRGSGQIPTSIDLLKPSSPYLQVLANLPLDPSVEIHTVMGRSDDIVPPESSRLAGAVSEVTLPGDHNVHATPAAVAELLRILREHRPRP